MYKWSEFIKKLKYFDNKKGWMRSYSSSVFSNKIELLE